MIPFDVALANQIAASVRLGIAAEQIAVGQDAYSFAGAFERANDVRQIRIVALLVRRHTERLEASEGIISVSSPVLQRLSENGGLATT